MKNNSTSNVGGRGFKLLPDFVTLPRKLDEGDLAILVREAHVRRCIRNLTKRQIADDEKVRLARLIGQERVCIPNGYIPRYLGAVITTRTKTDVDTKALIEAYARLTGTLETEVKTQFQKISDPFLNFAEAEK